MTNRKLHTPFRLVPKSTILDDLEWPIRTLLMKRCVFRSPPQKQEWRYTHTISGKNVANDSSFWRYKTYSNIRGGSPGRGVQQQWGCRERQISAFRWLFFGYFRDEAQLYYMTICSPSLAFQWSQNAWSWMTLTGYFTLKSVFAPVWLADTVRFWKIIAWKLIKIDTYFSSANLWHGL